jgi:hypothetical protein
LNLLNIRRSIDFIASVNAGNKLNLQCEDDLNILLNQENSSGVKFNHIKLFMNKFKELQTKKLSIKEMKTQIEMYYLDFPSLSLSSFKRYIVQFCGLRFRNEKYVHSAFNPEKKKECRLLTTKVIARLLVNTKPLYFYDESTIEIKVENSKNWGFMNDRVKNCIINKNLDISQFNL